jgi:hypothetical protein
VTKNERLWLDNFFAANGLDDNGATRRIPSQCSRKRHASILDSDALAIIITNRRLRAGIPQERISR